MSVDDLKARLRDEGEAVARGKVRVDSQRALLKLRQRLSTPGAYILELVRAAVAAGANRVAVRCDADDVELAHDGPPVAAAALRDLHVHAVGEEHEQEALWLLATGLNCGLVFHPRWIAVESGEARARLQPAGEIVVGAGPPVPGLRLHVKHRVGVAMRRLVARKDEVVLLRRRARHVPVELTVNGERIDEPPLSGLELLARREVQDGKLRVVAGLTATPAGARVTLATHGVEVAVRTLEDQSAHLVAWARHDELKLDASRGDVVDDDPIYQEILDRLRKLADDLLEDALARLGEERVAVTAAALAAHRAGKRSKRARALIDRAPLLPGPSGEWLSVTALMRNAKLVRFSTERLAEGEYDPPVVLFDPPPQALDLLHDAMLTDIKPELLARRRSEANRRRFEAQPVEEPKLSGGDDVARGGVEARDVRGEVGLLRLGGGATIRFLLGGRLLAEKEIEALRPLRLRAVVDGKRLAPSAAWDDVAVDDAHGVAVQAVRKAARRALLDRLEAGGLDGPDADALRAHAAEVLQDLVANDDPISDTLRRAAFIPLAGGGHISLARLADLDEARVAATRWPDPALDGKPVALLAGAMRAMVAGLLHRELRDVEARMAREREIRARIEGPKIEARLLGRLVARVAVEGEGLRGELGVPAEPAEGAALRVRLLREGVQLVDKELEARYAPAVGIVDCPALRPSPDWDDVQKSSALRRVVEKVQEAERMLAPAILETYPGIALENLPVPAREHVGAYLRVELGKEEARAAAEGPARALLTAPLFRTLGGPLVSLADIAALPGDLLTLDPNDWSVQPVPGTTVIVADLATRRIFREALGRTCLEARDELPRIARRQEFERLPQREARLAVKGVLKTAVRVEMPASKTVGLEGEVAHRPGGKPGAETELLLHGRPFGRVDVPGALPTTAILDLRRDLDPAEELTRSLTKSLARRIHDAELALVQAAAEQPDRPEARALLLELFALGADEKLPSSGTSQALSLPLLPTTAGTTIAVGALAFGEQRIRYVKLPLSARAADDEPVVVAVDPAVLRLLEARWPRRIEDITAEMAAQIESRQRHLSIPQVEAVRVAGEPLWRQPINARGVEGEVALGVLAQTLTVHIERRPVAVLPIATPPGVAAAASCDELVLLPNGEVLADPAYAGLVDAVMRAVAEMAASIAARWSTITAEQRDRLAPAAAGLAGWLVEHGRAVHSMVALPLLATSDRSPLSFARLLETLKRRGSIWVSGLAGSLADPDEVVWQPRPDERALAARLGWRLEDATSLLVAADAARRRPVMESLAAPLESGWREPVVGDGLEGEVAVAAAAPTGVAIVELLRDGRLAESYRGEHAVGFAARVRCDRLRPTPDGQRVARDDAFGRVQTAIGAALERLLGRLLAGGGEAAAAYIRAVAAWSPASVGPLAEAVAGAALFVDLAGAPVTVGRLRAEAAERGRVAVLLPRIPVPRRPPPRLVLAADEADRKLLDVLGIKLEVVLDAATQAIERERQLAAHRLSFGVEDAGQILSLDVDQDGWRGRLFLGRVDRAAGAAILFVRDGEPLDDVSPGYGISGILENPAAAVEADGLCYRLAGAERHRLATMFIEPIFARLADEAGGMPPERRAAAAHAALRFLSLRGVNSARSLDAAGPLGARLCAAPLFRTASSRWIDLRALADHVLRRGPIEVLPKPVDEAPGVTLLAPPPDGPRWIDALAIVLGSGALHWHSSMHAWELARRDAEPDETSPLYHGLSRLRAEAELLRGGAFAKLGARELSRIGLRRAGGKELVVYDPERAVAMLDPEHPAVHAALSDAAERPERIYVLLAAVYGVVNRWLEHVTDADEALACAALLEHLAANPTALRPRAPGPPI